MFPAINLPEDNNLSPAENVEKIFEMLNDFIQNNELSELLNSLGHYYMYIISLTEYTTLIAYATIEYNNESYLAILYGGAAARYQVYSWEYYLHYKYPTIDNPGYLNYLKDKMEDFVLHYCSVMYSFKDIQGMVL